MSSQFQYAYTQTNNHFCFSLFSVFMRLPASLECICSGERTWDAQLMSEVSLQL